MKSIAAFCVSETVSGGELYLLRILSALRRRGWQVLLVGGQHPALANAATRYGVDYRSARLGPKLGRSSAWTSLRTFRRQRKELLRLVGEARPGIVLLQYKLEQLLAGGGMPNTRTVVLEHGPIPAAVLSTPWLRRRYMRTVMEADLCLAASTPALESLHGLGRTALFLPAGVDVAGPPEPAPGRNIGLFAGRLEPNKGVEAAIALVLKSSKHSLIVAGNGSLADEIARRASARPDRLTYVGPVDDVDRLIQSSDFGILLTTDPGEGRPLFALECLARGRPVVGLHSSPAMRALAAEFTSGGIQLLETRHQGLGVLDSIDLSPVVPRVTSWGEIATQLDNELRRLWSG